MTCNKIYKRDINENYKNIMDTFGRVKIEKSRGKR